MTHSQAQVESNRAREQARKETAGLIIPKEPVRKLKFLNFLAIFTVALALGALVYFWYLIAWPQHPLVVRSVSVTTPVVHSPGSLTYQIDACKNVSLTPIVYRKIVQDNVGSSLPSSQGLATKGCRVTKVSIPIPGGIPSGDHYILYSDISYHVNALRDVHVYWHSQPFTVIGTNK